MNAGEYLRELRERRKVKKATLAKAVGVAWTTVNAWENGASVPRLSNINLIADKLKLMPAEKAQLIDLARPMRAREEVPMSRDSARAEREELETILSAAFDPKRHKIVDAHAVLAAMADATPLLKARPDAHDTARAWLDAASELRGMGAKITAATIAVVMLKTGGGGVPLRQAAG